MYINKTIKNYLDDLASNNPTPGGGSAAALTASLGAACLVMVANFTIGRAKYKFCQKEIKIVLAKLEKIRNRLLELVDLDAKAYAQVVESRNKSLREKLRAKKNAKRIPKEVCRLCHQALILAPVLAEKGNLNLISDVEVGVELLEAGFNAALVNVKINS
jgi:formiminotetrahydrofolate cyclodeaminase